MARISQNDTELQARRDQTARLYLQGRTQQEIADAVGIDQGTVSRDLAAIRKAWQASAVQMIGERTAEELARLDHLERTHWEAWQRTLTHRVRTYTRTRDGGVTEEVVEEEQRDGNPEHLRGVERCIMRRCEILGLIDRKPPTPSVSTVVVVGGIDLAAVAGQKAGLHAEYGRTSLN